MTKLDMREVNKLTLSNYIYTKNGKSKITSIEDRNGFVYINGISSDEILFFDITWVYSEHFALYGFEKIDDGKWVKGNIILKHFSFDHWHVVMNDEDFGERFYSARDLERIVKEKFGVTLSIL